MPDRTKLPAWRRRAFARNVRAGLVWERPELCAAPPAGERPSQRIARRKHERDLRLFRAWRAEQRAAAK